MNKYIYYFNLCPTVTSTMHQVKVTFKPNVFFFSFKHFYLERRTHSILQYTHRNEIHYCSKLVHLMLENICIRPTYSWLSKVKPFAREAKLFCKNNISDDCFLFTPTSFFGQILDFIFYHSRHQEQCILPSSKHSQITPDTQDNGTDGAVF